MPNFRKKHCSKAEKKTKKLNTKIFSKCASGHFICRCNKPVESLSHNHRHKHKTRKLHTTFHQKVFLPKEILWSRRMSFWKLDLNSCQEKEQSFWLKSKNSWESFFFWRKLPSNRPHGHVKSWQSYFSKTAKKIENQILLKKKTISTKISSGQNSQIFCSTSPIF